MPLLLRFLTLGLGLTLAAPACTSEDGPAPDGGTGGGVQIAAEVASSDLVAGEPQRILVGLIASDQRLVSFGEVGMAFAPLASEAECSTPPTSASIETTGAYLPTPGTPNADSGPALSLPSEARGVYQSEVEFDAPGIWLAEVTADVEGVGSLTALACFPVLKEHRIPGPGDRALRTENHTLDSKGVPQEAIDSTFAATGKIPDPELHRWTIADAIDRGIPALVVFATPTYCVSRFCGPVVDVVADLARRYDDRAAFIHVEIWRDNAGGVINEAAADWLLRDEDLREPWLYLIGADGRIAQRWGPLFDEDEVAAALEGLPELPNPTT